MQAESLFSFYTCTSRRSLQLRRALLAVVLIAAGCIGWRITWAGADMNKTLHVSLRAAETGFDPAATGDAYSPEVTAAVFETLYTYDYLARPVRLVPLTASALPEISDDGMTYTIRLQPGIYFQDDVAFGGKPRELTMADVVFSLKRLVDPKVRSPSSWMLRDKIVGLDEAVATGKGDFNYNTPIPGFELPDRYTLRIHLKRPDQNLGLILAFPATAALAPEIVKRYGDANRHVMAHPIGTGPYRLASWRPGSEMILEANKNYRKRLWEATPEDNATDRKTMQYMAGKTIPQIGRVILDVIVEDQASWLAFQSGKTDVFELDGQLASNALDGAHLKPQLGDRGVQLSRTLIPEMGYTAFNMQDPIVGGTSHAHIALRRAIAMAYDVPREISLLHSSQARPLAWPIPTGVIGDDPGYRTTVSENISLANRLLDRNGYHVGKDGWRTQPDGSPLTIQYSHTASSKGTLQAELWKRAYDLLHIRMTGDARPFPDLIRAQKQCRLQTSTANWIADYPDGDNFMQLFYGPNIGASNSSCVDLPDINRLYAESALLTDGPQRQMAYRKIARLLEYYAPIRLQAVRYWNVLTQPRVVGYKRHPVMYAGWMYADVAP